MDGTALTSGSAARSLPNASIFRFSTADFAPRDRLSAWREGVGGGVHLRLDVEPLDDAPPRATVEVHRWASASLYFGDTSPVRASRTPGLVQDGDGDFRLVRAEGAGFQFTAQGVDETIDDGCAALLFNGVPGTVRYFRSCRVTAIRLRRADLAAVVRGLEDRPIRRVAPGSPALQLLDSYARLLRAEKPAADPDLAGRVGQHLTDLVALALGTTRDLAENAALRGGRAARLRDIKADIEHRLGNEDLSTATIAARHRLPVRYVQRLFEADGVTFTEFVLEQRLLRAHRLLGDPRFATQPIGIVAFESGFTNQTYFNRTFRARFGVSPSEVRASLRHVAGAL
jgi:AraC-like DNA-binding protein